MTNKIENILRWIYELNQVDQVFFLFVLLINLHLILNSFSINIALKFGGQLLT